MIQTIKIEGMNCAHCAQRVQKVLESIENVESVTVDLITKQAQIQTTQSIELSVLQEVISQTGYRML